MRSTGVVLAGLLVTTASAFTGLVSRCAAVPRCATLRAALPRAELSDPESEALLAFRNEDGEAEGDVADDVRDVADWLLDDADDEDDDDETDWVDCEEADNDAGGDSAVQAMLDAFLADGGSFEETADVTDDEAGIAPDDEVNPAHAPTLVLTQPQDSPGPEPLPGIWRRQQ